MPPDYAFFFQAEDGIRGLYVTGVQTCALPISHPAISCAENDNRRNAAEVHGLCRHGATVATGSNRHGRVQYLFVSTASCPLPKPISYFWSRGFRRDGRRGNASLPHIEGLH